MESDFKTLQEKAKQKLRDDGYCAFVLRNLVKLPFRRRDDLENSYGIIYGVCFAPSAIESYAKNAYAEKSRKEFVDWLESHGGQINFSLVNTGERSTERWAKEHQRMAEKAGILCPEDKGWLLFSIMVESEKDYYMAEQTQPELYERFKKNLAAYLNGEMEL